MVPVGAVRVGDTVMVVDKWDEEYWGERAREFPVEWDKYLGNFYKVVGIFGHNHIKLDVDDEYLSFSHADLAYVVGGYGDIESEAELQPCNFEELNRMLF